MQLYIVLACLHFKGGMSLDKAFLSTIVSLDPGVVNSYPAGITSFKCTVHHKDAGAKAGVIIIQAP